MLFRQAKATGSAPVPTLQSSCDIKNKKIKKNSTPLFLNCQHASTESNPEMKMKVTVYKRKYFNRGAVNENYGNEHLPAKTGGLIGTTVLWRD